MFYFTSYLHYVVRSTMLINHRPETKFPTQKKLFVGLLIQVRVLGSRVWRSWGCNCQGIKYIGLIGLSCKIEFFERAIL
jgi:hypothetical protein